MLACITACLTSCILSFLLKKSGCAHLSIPSFSEILNLYYHRIFIVTCPFFFFFEDAYMTPCYARRKPNTLGCMGKSLEILNRGVTFQIFVF